MPAATGPIDVSLSLFSGLNTELSATDVPEGVSPDNQDMVYVPGGTSSRPCLHKLFGVPFAANPSVNYEKTYRQPNGNPLNLYLDALGVLRTEDVVNAPGAAGILASVAAGCFCNSVTAENGKEYFAFNDGVHGVDIPRQFDGTFLDRVSQDGPGASVTSVQDYIATVAINSIGAISNWLIAAGPGGATQSGFIVTITTTLAHGYIPGQQVFVVGVGVAGYNGLQTIGTVPSATTFTYTLSVSALAASGGGVVLAGFQIITATPHGLNPGDACSVQGSAAGDATTPWDNNVTGNPAFWTVAAVTSPTVLTVVLQAFGTGLTTTNGVTLGGTLTIGGMVSAGVHQCVVIFETRQGYLTVPSVPVSWVASGNKQAQVNGLPIGPPNVVRRHLAFTGAGGGNFFRIPASVKILNNTQGSQPIVVKSTVVPDNTSTTAIVDFSDNALFNAEGIDIPGNNLFNLVVLAPCLTVEAYADRLAWAGEFNKIQRFRNMGFEGGTAAVGGVTPLGWTIDTAGGTLVAAPVDFGLAWQITGDGTANAKGRITQTAYQNYLFNAILSPSTPYSFVCWAKAQLANQVGNLVCDLFSASQGVLATASIPLANISVNGAFIPLANFSANTPAVIPADTVLRVYATGMVNGQTVVVDEMMIVFTQQPYRDADFRVSYVKNPESYDGVTGDLGAESDSSPIRCTGIIRDTLYIVTADRLHQTRDNGGEPGTWTVSQIASKCGGVSSRCAVLGKNWMAWVSQNDSDLSLAILDGGDVFQISQEIQGDFSGLNQDAMQNIWAVNDAGGSAKRIYIGAPTGNSTTPNRILPLDYRELDTASEIASHGPIHISLAGKMISSDLARKWTRWNISASSGAILNRSRNRKQFCIGSGPNAQGASFGNVYFLDPNKFTDDDYGQFFPYYTTYFFVNHEMEQALPLGAHRKLYDKFTAFITGVGLVQITPLANRIDNPLKGLIPLDINGNSTIALTQTLKNDIELPGEVGAERCAFKVSVLPLPGTTDVSFNLQHLSCRLQAHPVSPLRGRVANG